MLSTRRIPAAPPHSQKTPVSPGAGHGQGPLPRDRESPYRSHWASFCAGCVALLGDPNQLLSVGAGNILSDLLTLGVPSICLQQQYRQSTDAAALRQNVVDFPKLNGEQELRWDDSFRLLPADDRSIPNGGCAALPGGREHSGPLASEAKNRLFGAGAQHPPSEPSQPPDRGKDGKGKIP